MYNLNLKLFDSLFNCIQQKTLNHYMKLYETVNIKWNHDNERVFIHFLIEELLFHSLNNNVVIFNNSFLKKEYEIFKYIEKNKIYKTIKKTIKKIANLYPFNIIDCSKKDISELKTIVQSKIYFLKNRTYSFKNTKRFLSKYGLQKLSKTISNSSNFV